jgi:hypothetical protein
MCRISKLRKRLLGRTFTNKVEVRGEKQEGRGGEKKKAKVQRGGAMTKDGRI